MSAARCTRLWEVEAARDRRLSGTALGAHAAHLAGCSDCRRERDALDGLAGRLRAAESPADEIALRRLRQTTLERAFELSRTPVETTGRRFAAAVASVARAPLAIALAALALIALGGTASNLLRHARHGAPSIRVIAGASGATWTRRSLKGVEQVELGEGAFSLVVRRRAHDPRVIVRVPEGEIEDFGTAFDVRVRAGRTERIAVREGVVSFRRHGSAPLRLTAGMVWKAEAAPPPPAPVAAAPVARMQDAPAPPALVAPEQPTPRAKRRSHLSAAPLPASVSTAPALRGDASTAVAEDAAYLHVLALVREGRSEEAKLAAALYVQDFPNGFRRVEMQRLAAR
jgi:hypothetical protein